jgi:hypothetical protein
VSALRHWFRFPLIAIAALAFLPLTACTTNVWTKDSFTQQDLLRDRDECARDMRQSGYSLGASWGGTNTQDFYDSCMVARGWRKVGEN